MCEQQRLYLRHIRYAIVFTPGPYEIESSTTKVVLLESWLFLLIRVL